jgi:hypothetical protein
MGRGRVEIEAFRTSCTDLIGWIIALDGLAAEFLKEAAVEIGTRESIKSRQARVRHRRIDVSGSSCFGNEAAEGSNVQSREENSFLRSSIKGFSQQVGTSILRGVRQRREPCR